jgi:ketosteroid isomerase-like protein
MRTNAIVASLAIDLHFRGRTIAEYQDDFSTNKELHMADLHALLNANLHDVFGNRDAASRRAAIEKTYTDDVVFTDPEGAVTGYDALEAKAAGLLDGVPSEFVFVEDGVPYAGADTVALAWAFGPSGSPVARGIDVITVRDGRISELRTLLNQ